MKAAVYRNNVGPVFVALLDGTDAPESASIPTSDPRPSVFDYKGSDLTWEEWAQSLADRPATGNWAVEDVPDGISAHAALVFVRNRDTARALSGT